MEYDTYNADAVQLAVDLANTDVRDPEAVVTFVRKNDDWFDPRLDRHLSDADQATIAALAAGVRGVAASTDDGEVIRQVNQLLDRCPPRPRMTDHDGTVHLHYSPDDAPLVHQLGATVAMGMALLIFRYGRERVGLCAAEDCADVFVDTSRNRSKRYCSDTCSSRTSVSAFRARQRSTPGP